MAWRRRGERSRTCDGARAPVGDVHKLAVACNDGGAQVLDAELLVEAHTHDAGLSTLSADWQAWVRTFGDGIPLGDLFDRDGAPRPDAIDDHFARQGADHVLLFSEYSPKATGVQPIEDVLPLVEFNPAPFP